MQDADVKELVVSEGHEQNHTSRDLYRIAAGFLTISTFGFGLLFTRVHKPLNMFPTPTYESPVPLSDPAHISSRPAPCFSDSGMEWTRRASSSCLLRNSSVREMLSAVSLTPSFAAVWALNLSQLARVSL